MKRGGGEKPRPVLVVSRPELNSGTTVTVVPFTTQQLTSRAQKPNNVFCNAGEGNLEEDSVAKCGDVMTLDFTKIDMAAGVLGTLDESKMKEIDDALRWSLGLDRNS
jgi:mRNA-degrading endonuclease toxin of MazEF toxin-antitoxin module